ncbi:MAG: NUDIX domain-containing protein [Pseudomonadota bacterium]
MKADPRAWAEEGPGFDGGKIALLFDGAVAVLRRDNISSIPWPNRIDLPGGGREGSESGVCCVLRETREEISLRLAPERVVWARLFSRSDGQLTWFCVARLYQFEPDRMRLGDEGQSCWMMPVADFLQSAESIPDLQVRLRCALSELGEPF